MTHPTLTLSGLSKSILILRLDDLQSSHKFSKPIGIASGSTTDRLLIVIFCELFNKDKGLSHTQTWNGVQRLLTFVYVEATRVAQQADRILMDVDVLLCGTDAIPNIRRDTKWDHVFHCDESPAEYSLPDWVNSLPATKLNPEPTPSPEVVTSEYVESKFPSTFPVVALGGTFDHLHSGHKILLSMAAWIAHEKVIIGVTDDSLLQNKSNKEVIEPIDVRISHVRKFMEFFKPGLVYDIVPISDVYGPTGFEPNIQALVVSKETVSGASAIAKHRQEKELPPLDCFVIDVISMTAANLEFENLDLLRQAKISSTFIREWIVEKSRAQN